MITRTRAAPPPPTRPTTTTTTAATTVSAVSLGFRATPVHASSRPRAVIRRVFFSWPQELSALALMLSAWWWSAVHCRRPEPEIFIPNDLDARSRTPKTLSYPEQRTLHPRPSRPYTLKPASSSKPCLSPEVEPLDNAGERILMKWRRAVIPKQDLIIVDIAAGGASGLGTLPTRRYSLKTPRMQC